MSPRSAALALVAGLGLVPVSAMAHPASHSAKEAHRAARTPAAAPDPSTHPAPTPSPEDATRYRSREHRDPQVADYEGGNLVVTGVTGGALLVVLLLVLLRG